MPYKPPKYSDLVERLGSVSDSYHSAREARGMFGRITDTLSGKDLLGKDQKRLGQLSIITQLLSAVASTDWGRTDKSAYIQTKAKCRSLKGDVLLGGCFYIRKTIEDSYSVRSPNWSDLYTVLGTALGITDEDQPEQEMLANCMQNFSIFLARNEILQHDLAAHGIDVSKVSEDLTSYSASRTSFEATARQ